MPRKVSTGINTVRRRGPDGAIVRVDYYDRASGLYLGTDRDQAIQRAAEGRAPPAPPPRNTFAGLATAYLGSPEYRALAPRTQALNRLYVDLLRDRFGDLPAAAITRPVVRALRDAHQAQPTKGNRLVSTLRLVLGYGVDIGTLATNAASRPGRLQERPRHGVWSDTHIERFLAVARPELRRAAALLLYTVQRPSDVLAMTWAAVIERRGRAWINLRQQKTAELMEVPLHRRAVELLGPRQTGLLVPAPRGGTWAYRNFARAWDRTVRRADDHLARASIATWPPRRDRTPGETDALKRALRADMITGLQRRDFRRTGMVKMAEAGASPSQIAAVSGHSINQTVRILDTYIPRRGAVALGAIEAWERPLQNATAVVPRSATAKKATAVKPLK